MNFRRVSIHFMMTGFALVWYARAGAVTVYNVDLTTQADFGNLNQHDVPACGMGDFACGPTAAVNSFVFLQNKYPDIYDHKLVPDNNPMNGMTDYQEMIDTAVALTDPAYMNCVVCNGGTLISDFISGKRKWINDHAPGTTVFADSPQSDWQFLYNELRDMEDVELLVGFYDAAGNRIGGHYVTLTKFQWTDTNMDNIIQATENAMIGFIDPDTGMNVMKSLVSQAVAGQYRLTTDYNVGGNVTTTGINWAVKESPVPEPATVALVALALFGVAGYRRSPRVG